MPGLSGVKVPTSRSPHAFDLVSSRPHCRRGIAFLGVVLAAWMASESRGLVLARVLG